jgi:carbohydrate-selective porin OprB
MADAITEVNATRPRTSHTRTLADAKLDYDVAMADARDAYERAVALAAGNAARAEMHAYKRYAVARANAKSAAASRRQAWFRFRHVDDVQKLVQLHSYVGLLADQPCASADDRAKRAEHVAMHRMLGNLLSRRGVTT